MWKGPECGEGLECGEGPECGEGQSLQVHGQHTCGNDKQRLLQGGLTSAMVDWMNAVALQTMTPSISLVQTPDWLKVKGGSSPGEIHSFVFQNVKKKIPNEQKL